MEFSNEGSSSRAKQKCMEEVYDWRVTGWGLKLEKEKNDLMLIETSSVYIIKMQIDTLQHITHTHRGSSI